MSMGKANGSAVKFPEFPGKNLSLIWNGCYSHSQFWGILAWEAADSPEVPWEGNCKCLCLDLWRFKMILLAKNNAL